MIEDYLSPVPVLPGETIEADYLKGSHSTIPSPPPVLGAELTGFTGRRSLTAPPPPPPPGLSTPGPGLFRSALLDLASNSLTVSRTRDFGRGGTCGLIGDLRGGRALSCFVLLWPAEAARSGERAARMESLSSSLLGRETGRGILDLPDLLDLPLSPDPASLLGVVWPVPSQEEPCHTS